MTYSIAYQMYSQLSVNVNLKKKEMRDNKTLLYFQKKLEKQYKDFRDKELIPLLKKERYAEAIKRAKVFNENMEGEITELKKKHDIPFAINKNKVTIQTKDIKTWLKTTIPTREKITALERRWAGSGRSVRSTSRYIRPIRSISSIRSFGSF